MSGLEAVKYINDLIIDLYKCTSTSSAFASLINALLGSIGVLAVFTEEKPNFFKISATYLSWMMKIPSSFCFTYNPKKKVSNDLLFRMVFVHSCCGNRVSNQDVGIERLLSAVEVSVAGYGFYCWDKVLAEYITNMEKAEKERDELKLTLEKLQNSLKSLNTLLDSQVSDKSKAGLGYKELIPKSFVKSSKLLEKQDNRSYKGYHEVPLPLTGNYMPPKQLIPKSFVKSSELLEKQDNRSDKGYHEVPLPLTGNYMPPKRNLRLIDEHFESEYVDVSNVSSSAVMTVKTADANHKGMVSKEEPKPVKKNSFSPPIIKD
nr:hypothetical protein [Tanacetum cinerariifolium]